jgi:ATP-binding cassette subfamily C protein
MKILLEFARIRPWTSLGLLLCLLVAGILEGLGLSSVLPLVRVAIDGSVSAEPSGIEARLVGLFSRVGLEPTLGVLLWVITAAFAAKAALILFARRQIGYAVARIVADLRLRLLRALLRADWTFFVHRPVGSFANSFVTEAQRSAAAYMNATWLVFRVMELGIYATIAFVASWRVTIVALLIGTLLVLGLSGLVRAGRHAGTRQTKLFRSLLGRFSDLLQGSKALKAMGRVEDMAPLLEEETLRVQRVRQHQVFVKEALPALQEPMVVGVFALGLFVGVATLGLELPHLLLLAVLLERTYSAMNKAQRRYQKVALDESAHFALLRTIAEAEARAERLGSGPRVRLADRIELEDVHFAYGEQDVLRGVDLTIPAGSVTALTGPSGAGKTTVLDLVVGLVQPDAGQVRVDGTPLTELDLGAWRRSIGYVPQEANLLHDTVAANVRLGDATVSDAQVVAALRAAHAWDFVEALPEGLDTVVGERGSALSGGQCQRISIARALVHGPSLLILDEATTSLDPASEAAVLDAVRELASRTTVLAVSHQPALLRIADLVYHVAEGQVDDASGDGSPRVAFVGGQG